MDVSDVVDGPADGVEQRRAAAGEILPLALCKIILNKFDWVI